MLKQDSYYTELDTGIRFRVMGSNGGSYICKDIVTGKLFVWTDDELSKKNLQSIPKPASEYIGTAQIRGGEIQDRTFS
jgi:hypothetical protein